MAKNEQAVAADETEKKKPPVRRGPRDSKYYNLDDKIKVLAKENPKKAGSKTYDRWNNYKDGMTVREVMEKGTTQEDLIYDWRHEFISIQHVRPRQAPLPPAPPKKVRAKKSKDEKAGETAGASAA